MKDMDIEEIRREWTEYSRRVEERTEGIVTPEMLHRSIRSEGAALRRYGWVNTLGGCAVIPFVLWYLAHYYGVGLFFWLMLSLLAVAALFSVYQLVVYYRAGRVDEGVVQHASMVVRYMRLERWMTIGVYVYMFALLAYIYFRNLFGEGGSGDTGLFVKYLLLSLVLMVLGIWISWRIMRWEHRKLERLNRTARELEEFLAEESHEEDKNI